MRIAITGHMDITAASVPLLAAAIRERLQQIPELVGVSCIAPGSDAVFAQAVLDVGGTLEVVLPSADYRRAKVEPDYAPVFDALLANADTVRTMPFPTADPDAYVAANNAMLDDADELIAVWDGRPAADHGGTAGAVLDAKERGLPVTVIWPAGVERE